jgi:RNA polymerase sigma-70 factor, ECF subfamily
MVGGDQWLPPVRVLRVVPWCVSSSPVTFSGYHLPGTIHKKMRLEANATFRSASHGACPAESSFALLMRARNGDEAARNELCARYLPRLRRWAHGRLPVSAREILDTEDIVQDTLLQSVRRLEAFTPHHERAFCAYVCEALRNRLRDTMRRSIRRPAGVPVSVDAVALEPSPLEQAVGRQTLQRYESALERLRESDRELVIARVELGLDYTEIAALHGKASVASARVAVSRALIRLGAEMGHERRA